MHVITVETPSLGDRSYIVHDGAEAVVIDPQRDIDRITEHLEAEGLTVVAVLETHVHNDYVSGGLTLARVTGAEVVHAADEPVRFDHRGVVDGDTIQAGRLTVTVMHTPGHTPNHLSFVIDDGDEQAAFTGGSLLYGSVGRTDLIDPDRTEDLSRQQYRSAQRLAEHVRADAALYPTHGFGSFCSSASSEGDSDGTLAGELAVNVAFRFDDEDQFAEHLIAGLSAFPRYYAHMGPMNLAGATPVDLSPPALVDLTDLARRIHRNEWVIDLRHRRVYAHEHLVGTIGIELSDSFSTYLGWLIPWGTPITLLGETVEQVADAQRQMARIGLDRPAGARIGHGPISWAPEHEVHKYDAITFADLGDYPEPTVLDVRRDDERASGHVDGSLHVPLDELLGRRGELPDTTLFVHCRSGFRASIAASLLDRAGHDVVLIDDDVENADLVGVSSSS